MKYRILFLLVLIGLRFATTVVAQDKNLAYDYLIHFTCPLPAEKIEDEETWKDFDTIVRTADVFALVVLDSLDDKATDKMMVRVGKLINRHPKAIFSLLFFKTQNKSLLASTAYQALEGNIASDSTDIYIRKNTLIESGKRLFVYARNRKGFDPFFCLNGIKNSLNSFGKPLRIMVTRELVPLPNRYSAFDPSKHLEVYHNMLDKWTHIGQTPNFLYFKNYIPAFVYYWEKLNNTRIMRGEIESEAPGELAVSWTGSFSGVSPKRFSFPVGHNGSVKMVPRRSGYFFTPDTLSFASNEFSDSLILQMSPIPLAYDLAVAIPFGERPNYQDFSRKMHFTDIHILDDAERGQVGYFNGKSSMIELTNTQDLGIYDGSFTVAFWIKVKEFKDAFENIVNTDQNRFLMGLHLSLQYKKPHFGFYSQDTKSSTRFEQDKWYHIVWRYDMEERQQSIFINGELDAIGKDKHSFHGLGMVRIGQRASFTNTNDSSSYFNGYLDDLYVWRRALTDKEISGIANGKEVEIVYKKKDNISLVYPIIGLNIIAVLALAGFQRKKIKKKFFAKNKITEQNIVFGTREVELGTHDIRIFGKFRLTNLKGEDISGHFSPKLKSLFLLLLRNSSVQNGIRSDKLSETLWPKLPESKANNNRRVNIRKLKVTLEEHGGPSLHKNGDVYSIGNLETSRFDFQELDLLLSADSMNDETISGILEIISAGPFPQNIRDEWYDEWKAETFDRIFSCLAPLTEKDSASDDLRLKICGALLAFDPLSEPACFNKIRILASQGKKREASRIFDRFKNEYKLRYDETFEQSFSDITSETVS
ncbi:LamG domain-containing protein [Fulvitalea axinellae]